MTESAGPGLLELVRVVAALAAVLALVVLASWLLRRASAGRRNARLAVEERVALARGVQLVVVSADGRRLLLGVSEKQVNLVTELDGDLDAEDDAADETATRFPAAVAPPEPSKLPDVARWLAGRWPKKRSR